MTSFLDIEEIIKKDFDFAKDLVEIKNIEDLNSDGFIYIIEIDNYDNNKYSTYCDYLYSVFLNFINNLQNRNIEEIDNEDNTLTKQEIIELYENHNNCKLYFFKEK